MRKQPKARLLVNPDAGILLACGVDPASLPIFHDKLHNKALLIERVKLFAANILKQTMLSIGGDVAVHHGVVAGKVEYSNCVVMGDLRHFRRLVEKLRQQPYMVSWADLIENHIFASRNGLELNLCGKSFTWDNLPVIMGIVNVTPDSFSDGGAFYDGEQAYTHAMRLIEQGAEIIDIGGESTRPGALPVDAQTEIGRVAPLIARLAKDGSVPLSIDTQKAEVARAAIDAGAVVVNDVSAGMFDPQMLEVIRSTDAGYILMHMRGTPRDMQKNTSYDDIVQEVFDALAGRITACLDAGMDATRILVDPGIGFGKDRDGNLSLIKHIAEFRSLGVPVVLGHSRKSFIGQSLDLAVQDREEGTDAVTAWAVMQDVDIIRVHNAAHAMRIRTMLRAVRMSR